MQRRDPSYDYWVFSATAFLTQTSVGSNFQNTVWWYVTRKFENKQQIAELSYTFATVGALTSYAVSPDAPQLCMTSEDVSGGQYYIYIDDVARAAI
jgi:hypothetical protein